MGESLWVRKDLLTQLQRMANVGAVASSVAHEFNNILTMILNQAKMGAMAKDPATRDRAFEKILAGARRAAMITTGVLALSRQRSPKKDPTDLAKIIDEVLAVVEKDLINHRVQLTRDLQPMPPVCVIAPQIEQVLINLIINARQAMPQGGKLLLSLRPNVSADLAEIRVQDTGTGIDPKILGKIFDPFFTTKIGPDEAGHGGSGLGLAICREIVEHHGGRIRVESQLGKGSAFTIKLPMTATPAQTRAA